VGKKNKDGRNPKPGHTVRQNWPNRAEKGKKNVGVRARTRVEEIPEATRKQSDSKRHDRKHFLAILTTQTMTFKRRKEGERKRY